MRYLLLLFSFCSLLNSQTVPFNASDWKNYTDIKNIYDLAFSGENIWAATTGGAFQYNKSTKTFKTYTNVEGLSSIDITAITIDSKNRVWFGNSNGWIDYYDLNSQTWVHISDLFFASNYLKKSIHSFLSVGDSVYIATDFGVSVYDIKKKDFQDTYLKFGKFPSSTPVQNVKIYNNRIWVATQIGLATAKLSSKNLLSPEEWINFDLANGLVSNMISSMVLFNGNLYIGSNAGLSKIADDVISSQYFSGYNIKNLFSTSTYLYIATEYSIYSFDKNSLSTKISTDLKYQISTVKIDDNGILWVGFSNNGMAYLNGDKWEYLKINCPNSNRFINLAVDDDGVLWSASGITGQGRGFYSLEDGIWTNFNKENYPILKSDDFHKVAIGSNNSKWFGSWGSGIALIKNDGSLKIFNETNSQLSGIPNDPKWVTIGGLSHDGKGNIWVLNYGAVSGNGLVSFSPDSTWNAYKNGINPNITMCSEIVVDDIGTKFFITSKYETMQGLFFFNEKYKLPSTSSSTGIIGLDEILPGSSNPAVNCLALDRLGSLWVGTDQGVSQVLYTRDPRSRILRPCYTTRCNISGQFINCITVDALNNKWIGTKSSGIWVLSPDGSYVLAQFNVSNSKILDNDIKSIAIDHKRGIIYIGTEKGLSTLKTILIEPLGGFSEKLKISPNPFIPGTNNLMIDGLVESSMIKILTTNGELVKSFLSPGGRVAFWDGRDESNNLIPSGVYFIIAYPSDGSQSTVGKVAVIRR